MPARLGAPGRLAPGGAPYQVGQHVRGERGGDSGLDLASLAVGECGSGGLDAGGGVRQVVGEDLLVVEALAAVGQRGEASGGDGDEIGAEVDRRLGRCEVVGSVVRCHDRRLLAADHGH